MDRRIVIVIAVLSIGVFLSLCGSAHAQWQQIGRASNVVAMAAVNGKLFAATKNNQLWMRESVPHNVRWQYIGHANNIVGMAAVNGKLFAATKDNRLWMREPVPRNVAWQHIGHANNVVAMAALGSKLFAATSDNRLWMREPVPSDVSWQHIGHANNTVGMAAANGKLFAATKDNKLWMRLPVPYDVPWKQIDQANGVVGFTALDNGLFAADNRNRLWMRTAPVESTQETEPGVVTIDILYKDADGTSQLGQTQISVREGAHGCEYRLEYNPANPTNWPIDEIAGDRGPAQRHPSTTCTVPDFTVADADNKAQFEEQTVYYWTKEAREYAKNHLWITPPGWTGGPIKHANDRVGPNVLTQGAFSVACVPITSSQDGCMRAWPHEGPKIHIKAGETTDHLVAHEFGHYAAGYVFGHMDISFVPGFSIGFDPAKCDQRSFQEAIAEMFMSVFLHDARYGYYVTQNPVVSGVPSSSFYLSRTDQWNNQCGATDYWMGLPLAQAFHKTLWDSVWSSPANANKSMVNAFSYALAKNTGHRIDDLAYTILQWLGEHADPEESAQAHNIFAAHGMAPKALGDTCFANTECKSGYCDAGDGTSKTNRCMPNNNGRPGDICSHDDQCASHNCAGLRPHSDGKNWIPGQCSNSSTKPLGMYCFSNSQCSSGYCDRGDGTSKTSLCMPNRNGRIGDICSHDNQCTSGICEGLRASGGQWIPGRCGNKFALGHNCSQNHQCASGYCDAGNGTSRTDRCMPNRNGRSGDICSHDNQCTSGNCEGLRASGNRWIPGKCSSKFALGHNCSQNHQCASGYCDAGNGTSRTNRCMPNNNGRRGDICSHHHQCLSRVCNGLRASGNRWIPGECL